MNKTTLSLFLAFSAIAFGQNRANLTGNQFRPNPNVAQNINAITPITAAIAYQGVGEPEAYLGQAEYEIFPDNIDGILDKPIILLDGFDPNDGRDIPSIYGLLAYGPGQNLADDLRNQGYDVVILNFPNYTRPATSTLVSGGSDFIQRNAMVLVELINQINATKVGTEQNVVIGPSMGGLIARYGLRYMEMNSLNHDTRLYISFDAPHNGANIPIGFQHLFNYMANGPLADATVQILVDAMLKSTASRQMLIDQFEGHLETGNPVEFDETLLLPTGKPGFRTEFQTELDAMGFPSTIRNVAISNGAMNGAMNGTPGMVVMDHIFNVTDTQRAIINLNFTPLANQDIQVSRFRGQIYIFTWINAYQSLAHSQSPADNDGLDAAPGGKFDITSLAGLAGSNALLTEFFDNINIDYFDFVPTNSSLAVIGQPNFYTPITGSTNTPFDAYYAPTVNENHVTLTPANMAFALNEILNPVMAVPNHTFAGLQVLNPVGNTIDLFTTYNIADATVSVTDLTGKVIFEKDGVSFNGNYQIPLTLNSGMYLLNIQNSEGKVTKKIIKN